MRIPRGVDPKVAKDLADHQGKLAKIVAKAAVNDLETDNEKKKDG
jgi:hypothetical protein